MTPASRLRHFLILSILFLVWGATGCVPPPLSSGVAATPTFVTTTIPAPTTQPAPSIPATSTTTLLLAYTLTPSSTVTSLPTLEGCAIGSTRVRSGPGIDYALVSGLGENECVHLWGRNEEGSWVFITGVDKDGWVLTSLLNISGEVAQLQAFSPDESPMTLLQTVQFPYLSTPVAERTLLPTRTPTILPVGTPIPPEKLPF